METRRFEAQLNEVVTATARPLMYAGNSSLTNSHVPTRRHSNQLECGPMPNVMAALPNIGGALCSTPQSLADAHYSRVPCSNAAKTRNPLKLQGYPKLVNRS